MTFPSPQPVTSRAEANRRVALAIEQWKTSTAEQANSIADLIEREYPDQEPPDAFWDTASSSAFRDFFVWGHDHDFGCGRVRRGAMATRHLEITAEAMEHGLLATDLTGTRVLDVGCWSGGDVLVLAGLGGETTAIEEHPIAAKAARRLLELSGCSVEVIEDSLYSERVDWVHQFDYVYCSGVIYHVTDPLLFARILFAYLKPGGAILLESKAVFGEDSICGYSGTMEKGWNWYAPNEIVFGRWLVDAGFDASSVRVLRRANGRLLAWAKKHEACAMRETAGFSRPGSWLEGVV
ncbi:class I SAM-dependent methyltransferase [Thiocystis violacea]|uniref:class I SAM-dependent methyltransferase n=1 Tax=Thiocystis violacea TaxID=13725 RepID=UPI00190590E6|nr:class I SAM-dependent methyltransferase [Thiocystis violacea]